MVEDALKVTRNLQRLLLVVCVVAVVFLASLRDVSEEVELLQNLREFPLLFSDQEFSRWLRIHHTSEAAHEERLEALFTTLAVELRPLGRPDLEPLRQVLAAPAHVGRIILPAPDFNDRSLTELRNLLSALPLKDNSQHIYADPRDLLGPLSDAIADAASTRFAIRNVQLRLVDPPPPENEGTSFVDGEITLELYFELHSPGRSAPTRTLTLNGFVHYPSGSSWRSWRMTQVPVPAFHNDYLWERSVSPPLDPNKPLGRLVDELEARIETAQAGNRTIDLAGVSIPGTLALFGIPTIIFGFAGSLLIHLGHLHRLAARHRQTFEEFAWTPVSPGDLWLWETTGLLLVLPVGVHLLLIYRAPAFSGSLWVPVVAGFVGALASGLAGVALLRSIGRLRDRLNLR